MMRKPTRRITHGHEAGRKVAQKLLTQAGVPKSAVGFSRNGSYYLIITGLIGGRVLEYPVVHWGMKRLRGTVEEFLRDWRSA